MNQDNSIKLAEFIEATKLKGASDEFLTTLLVHQGWPENEVFSSLGKHWEQLTGLPVPERSGRGESSREAFLYLLMFATLATWAGALGSMLFRIIDYWFADPVMHYNVMYVSLRDSVTWQMASIAVAFPIFLLVVRMILAEAHRHPERLQSGVRKWLTYIALLLTAGGIISDLICFLDYFLKGELTTPFLLKVLTVLLICGGIFFYYLRSLRWSTEIDTVESNGRNRIFGIGSLAIVVVAFCIGMGVAGTPSSQRHLEADKRRVQDLRSIAEAAHGWVTTAAFNSTGGLPANLNSLVGHGVNGTQIVDPETHAPYEYKALSDKTYELCATFAAPEEAGQEARSRTWNHGKGRTCFRLDASALTYW